MKAIELYRSRILENHVALVLAARRLEELDTASLNLGDTSTAEFEAITGIHPSNLELNDIKRLKVTKRVIIFSINGVVFYGNKYGVICTELPCSTGAKLGLWTHTWHSFLGDAERAMKGLLGARIEYKTRDNIYNYST